MRGRARASALLLAITAAAAAAAVVLIAAPGCGEHPKVVRPITVKVAILPEYSLPVMMSRYAPLINRMQEAIGPRYRIEWISCPSQETFMATVENERPAISIQDALHTALLGKLQDARPVLQAVNGEGRAITHGVLIAREEISALHAGDRIYIPSRRSLLSITELNMTPAADGLLGPASSARIVPVRWQDEVVAQVRRGTAAAGLVTEDAVEPDLHIIATGKPLPSACVVVFPQTNPEVAMALCTALVRLSAEDPRDKPILDRLGIGGFITVDRNGAERIRNLVERPDIPF